MRDSNGLIVFEMDDIEVPKFWSQVATDVLAQKYFRKQGVPQYDKNGVQLFNDDGTPIIGPTPYSNLYLNTGHGTLGWTMSVGSGKLLASLISGIESEISMEGIDMSRYNYANKTSLNYG